MMYAIIACNNDVLHASNDDLLCMHLQSLLDILAVLELI